VKKSVLSVFIAVFIVIFALIPLHSDANRAMSEELGEAMTKAEKAREKAADFKSPSYFPGEWEKAEALYAQAGRMPKNTDDDVKKAAEAYDEAAKLYESVLNLTIPLYAQAVEDEIMSVRDELVTAGAKDAHPEFFIPADREAVLALDQLEAEDYYTARETADSALSLFNLLKTAYNVRMVRNDIIERGFENYVSEEFDKGDEFFSAAMDTYTEKNIPGTKTNLDEALKKYNLVLITGWIEYAKLHRSLAETERKAALDVKADVAAKDQFNEADSVHKNSDRLFEANSHEESARGFILAESLYIAAGTATSEKRRTAEEAINNAKAAIEEANESLRFLSMAQRAFDSGDYDAATEYGKESARLASGATAPATPAPAVASRPTTAARPAGNTGTVFPATYRVRAWGVSNDCFWNIAGRPWVYNDPYKWRILYEANKRKLPNPNNPNIITPGTVLEIPPIKGETRRGAWERGKTYPTLR